MSIECKICKTPDYLPSGDPNVCMECYLDPETSNCLACGKHLPGITFSCLCKECLKVKNQNPAKCLHGTIMSKCKNCEKTDYLRSEDPDVCMECYRNPETNNCCECGKHLEGITYEYVCGDCLRARKK